MRSFLFRCSQDAGQLWKVDWKLVIVHIFVFTKSYFAKLPNAYFANWKCYFSPNCLILNHFFAKWFRKLVHAVAWMGRNDVFLNPGMVTMGSELGPAGPEKKIQHLAVWRKVTRQMKISIWRISFHLAVWQKMIRQMEIFIWRNSFHLANHPFGESFFAKLPNADF